jgi:[ribosomal protein S18]-alanine N-acetyltransferase
VIEEMYMNLHVKQLECRKLTIDWKQPLANFLRDLEKVGDNKYFHPHPFTDEALNRVVQYTGRDIYYILVEEDNVLGYGLLRGWDEGYKIPSLGVAIHPSARKTGLGTMFMHFLHAAARRNGATQVRLRVYPDNIKALELYKRIGYKFKTKESEYLVGIFDL